MLWLDGLTLCIRNTGNEWRNHLLKPLPPSRYPWECFRLDSSVLLDSTWREQHNTPTTIRAHCHIHSLVPRHPCCGVETRLECNHVITCQQMNTKRTQQFSIPKQTSGFCKVFSTPTKITIFYLQTSLPCFLPSSLGHTFLVWFCIRISFAS